MWGRSVLAAASGAVFICVSMTAWAHDFWINRGKYVGPDGVHCCGPNDCIEIPATQVLASTQGYRRLTYGEVVPYREALTSEDGKYWRCRKRDGSRRCFFAPLPGV